eukprot:UN00372
MRSLLILILYEILSIKSDEISCQFTVDLNTTYDLSELSKMGRLQTTDVTNTALTYYFSVCRNLTGDVCTEQYPGIGCAQQWTDGSCSLWLGGWDANPTVNIVNMSFPGRGITVEFDNGEECYKEIGRIYPYKTRFIFLCDKQTKFRALPAFVNEHDKCLYEIPIHSNAACAGYKPSGGGGSSSSSMSVGLVIIIIFFVAIICGLILYYVVLGIKTKNWGTQSMAPPLNLCRYFWVYTCV